jgi:hypothetical protein
MTGIKQKGLVMRPKPIKNLPSMLMRQNSIKSMLMRQNSMSVAQLND